MVHASSDGPACRHWPDMDTCKKRGSVKVKRRKLMSPGHWFFPELRCQSGSSVHITDLSHLLTHHFPAGIKFYLSLHHKKKKQKHRSRLTTYLPAFILFLRPMCVAIGCPVLSGDGGGGGDGKHVMADQVTDDTVGLLWCPSGHVTWWRGCTSRPVLAKTYLSCYLFCVYYSMFPSLDPSMRTQRHVEIHTTLPAHSKAFSLKLLTHPLDLLPSIFFFSSFFQASNPTLFESCCLFRRCGRCIFSAAPLLHLFFLSSALHRHPSPLGVGWISIIPLRYNDFKWALIIEFVIVVFLLWYAFLVALIL